MLARMSDEPLTIDVVSDVVCPWCYLGKRRLARAVGLVPEVPVVVRWRPFRLDPTIPPEGIARAEYVSAKFGGLDALDESHRHLTERGHEEGIDYHFDRILRSPNTVDAHRLVHWAAADGVQDDMVERLFAAYFSEGLDIGDGETLADLAADVGLDSRTISSRLASDEDRKLIVAEIENAYRVGVSGVPCFIFDRRLAVTGAHPAEVLVQAIEQAMAERDTADAGQR
jgi:predicted DsbA family dithiol-disulfide isomerase